MIDKLIIVFTLLNVGLLIAVLLNLRRLKTLITYFSDENYANNLLTEYEQEQQARQAAFDERIRRLKEELALSSTKGETERHGEPAPEFHPLVKNLPHNSIKIRGVSEPPDVEYAE